MLRNGPTRNMPAGSNRSSNSKGKDDEGPQLVAVAVDNDKNSQHALKWAADHIIARDNIFALVHVRTQPAAPAGELDLNSEFDDGAPAQMDIQVQELLTPFHCFCSRRGLTCKEVVLADMNISKAIIDFVLQHGVDKLVLGASSRNAISRAFKQADVPSSLSKITPDFCSVYVVSKGKMISSRPATRPKSQYFGGVAKGFEFTANQPQSSKSEIIPRSHMDDPRRDALINSTRAGYSGQTGAPWIQDQRYMERGVGEPLEPTFHSVASCATTPRRSVDKKTNYSPQVHDVGRQQPRLSASSNHENGYFEEQMKSFESYRTAGASGEYGQFPPTDETESEIRRLKLELKMAVDKCQDTSEKVYSRKTNDKPMGGDLWLERERATGVNKKDETRLSFLAIGRKTEINSEKEIERESMFPQRMGTEFLSDAQFKKYSIDEIKEVTNNFSESLKIGEGGYGPVFKSMLNGTPVAIKIPRPDVARGMEQFQQEVEVLSRIRHPNLVLLMGACPEHGCLVYEYMENGNLEDLIFCRSGTAPLTWQLRFKIAAEIGSALLYLHQSKPEPLVHRDLKPANILLDGNFASKITDVGLARLLPPSTSTCSSQYLATVAAGTFCYIDPEYQKTGTVGVKSDVYALGIILLQLLTGRPPMGLAYTTEDALEMGTFDKMLDPKVPNWPMEAALKVANMAVTCAELRRRDRPDLASVVLPELNRLRELADASL